MSLGDMIRPPRKEPPMTHPTDNIETVKAERDHLRRVVHELFTEVEIITEEVQHLRAREAQYTGKIID